MGKTKSYPIYRLIYWAVKLSYPKMEVVGAENLPDGPYLAVGNHAQLHGPVACELYFPGNRYTWCAHQMMERKEVPAYAYQDFWSGKPKWCRWFYKGLSYVLAPISSCVFNNANTIAVYRDNRIITTFKQTVQRLEEGNGVVVFPECYEPHNHIVLQFQENFISIAKLYYKRTGKKLDFVPLYVCPDLHKLVLGKPITFDPEAPIEEERHRICQELMDAVTALAEALPEHTVVPYPNIPKKQYPKSKRGDYHENTCC